MRGEGEGEGEHLDVEGDLHAHCGDPGGVGEEGEVQGGGEHHRHFRTRHFHLGRGWRRRGRIKRSESMWWCHHCGGRGDKG